jgi:tetratricopeptide (TPR) repeat protein
MESIMGVLRVTAATLLFLLSITKAATGDQTDPRLENLFIKLKNAEIFSIARSAEHEIWTIWLERPGEPQVDEAMRRGLRAMREAAYADALAAFDDAVRLAPDFAEAWNKRATVYYLIGDYEKSIADIDRTLALEPRHFGALSGLGMIRLALGQKAEALAAYEAGIAIHPFLQARGFIDALRQEVQGQKI